MNYGCLHAWTRVTGSCEDVAVVLSATIIRLAPTSDILLNARFC